MSAGDRTLESTQSVDSGLEEAPKRYRHFLSIEQKVAVIDLIDKARRRGCSNMVVQMRRVAASFGISPSTAYHIYQKRDTTKVHYELKMKQLKSPTEKPVLSHHHQRNFLPLEQKLRIVQMIEERRADGRRESFKEIGRHFGVSTSCAFSTYMKRAMLWQQFKRQSNEGSGYDSEGSFGRENDLDASPSPFSSSSSSSPPTESPHSEDQRSITVFTADSRRTPTPNVRAFSIDVLLGLDPTTSKNELNDTMPETDFLSTRQPLLKQKVAATPATSSLPSDHRIAKSFVPFLSYRV